MSSSKREGDRKLPFDPSRIRFDTPPMTIFEAMRKIERGSIRLNPEFQRNFVWDAQRQSRLIESILLRVPLPAFYLDATHERQAQVIDGFQRLSTLYAFCNTNTLHLEELEFLTHLNGATFRDLSEFDQQLVEDTPLNVITILPDTPAHVKFVIFQRINTGGIALNAQEIRHALYEGPARDLLRELAETEAFRAATGGLTDTRRMEDRECVLRFLTLRLNPEYIGMHSDGSELSYSDLLNRTMGDLNELSAAARDQFTLDFQDSMRKAQHVFGDLAFREVFDPQHPGPFRKQLFDVWSIMFSQTPWERIEQHHAAIQQQAIGVMNNDTAFVTAIKPESDDWPSVARRFETVRSILNAL